jgi:ribonuclease R
MIGTIALIFSKYVILNEKKFIVYSPLIHQLLPNDQVEYSIDINQHIHITRLVHRTKQYFMAIVNYVLDDKITVTVHGFPPFFSPQFLNQNHAAGDALIICADIEGFSIHQSYGSIQNRSFDKSLFVSLYQLNATSSRISWNITPGHSHYTAEFQDLTHLHTFNVDPTHSKDFDDAVSVEQLSDGQIVVYIHIVDAHHLLPLHSEIEQHAFANAFTLYLPEHIENILPSELAENECSLVKGKPRRVITIRYEIDEKQEITRYDIYPSIIKIKERYDYDTFNNALQCGEFRSLIDFTTRWEKATLAIPSVRITTKEDGTIAEHHHEFNIDKAHKIIETLMILTNLTISKHIGSSIPQRFHRKLYQTPANSMSNNDMIQSILTVKTYRNAVYDPTESGHFGLGLSTYTHFTSPIRRYFDVIVHRMLAGYTLMDVDETLEIINQRERQIDQLVKLYHTVKQLSYYQEHLLDTYIAYVIKVTEKGIVVLMEDFLNEVFVYTKDTSYRVGDRISVTIVSITWSTLTLHVKI